MAPQQNENTEPGTADERNPRITFALRPEDWEQLDRVAKARRSSVSQLCREIVGAALDAGYANA
ncbi:hypothetical protein LCGC14_0678440 [marine sediment metagenome]|uniref:Ribbon-helix-helix protein, CopG family n=2 Tax=root TaxID=1 RepID=A0A9C9TII8_9HYPH|nr:hypothetical protein [Aurantimonas coralicida]